MPANFPAPQMIEANGVSIAIYEADGDPDRRRPPVILVHGWPEIAYSWRNQLNALADAGFRTIALDLKGFGRSDAPKAIELYDVEHMTGDLAALLDALDIDRAVFCGHDWGGAMVWSMGQWRTRRVAGIIGVCTPLHPRPPAPPVEIIKKRFTDKHYFVQFQEQGAPEALFETDIERFVRLLFQRPAPRAAWPKLIPHVYDLPGQFKENKPQKPENALLSEEDVRVYVEAFARSGFHGGINLYRNVDRNWALMEGREEMVRAPALWIGAELDLFLPPEGAEGMEKLVPDLEKHVINDAGHWLAVEKPDALNALISDWLNRRFSN